MGALPESLDLERPSGSPLPVASMGSTDFGLGHAAEEASQVGQLAERAQRYQQAAQMRADQQTAGTYAQKLQADNADSYAADAAAYTGDQPGFASDQIAKVKASGQSVMDLASGMGESAGVQAQLSHMVNRYTAQVGDTAIAHEAQVRAQPIAEARQAQQQVQLAGGLTAFQTTFAPAQAQLYEGYDGSRPGLTQDVSSAWDAASAPAIAATPASLQPQLTAKLAAMKTEEIAKASEVEAHGAIKYVLGAATSQADSLINSVTASPLSYDQASATLPSVIANVPAAQRAPLQKQLQGELAKARLDGLILNGQPAQAQAEIKDNRYGALLQPEAVEGLLARADSAMQDHAPRSIDQAADQRSLKQRAIGAINAITTGGTPSADAPSIDEMTHAFGFAAADDYRAKQTAAFQSHATYGSAATASMDQLHQMAAQPLPDPSSPTYSQDLPIVQARKAAASDQLTARANPGAWAFSSGPQSRVGKNGAPAPMRPGDYSNPVPGMYQAIGQAQTPQDRATAATAFAARMLGKQESAGMDQKTWQIVPPQEASRLAASMTSAAPENRLAAYTQVAQLVDAMPTSIRAQDGSLVSPRALLARQLQTAGASLTDVSAIADYGADPSRMGRYTAALNNPSAAKPLDNNDEQALQTTISSLITPALAARAPLPGEDLFRQARIERTVLVARNLVQSQGMSPAAAARSAVGDLTQGEVLVNGQRLPAAVANSTGFQNPFANGGNLIAPSGASEVQQGQAKVLRDLLNPSGKLINGDGAGLFAPGATPGNSEQQRQQFGLQVQKVGKWVTSSDGFSSTLMVPSKTGGFMPVADRYGHPITATWSQLQTQANPGAKPMFGVPGPGTLHTADGQPVAAVSRSRALSLFQQALVGTESGGRNGLESPAGALGPWQVMPQTAAPYAARIFGAPLDTNRLQHDPAYNQRIGQAVLGHAMSRFGGDPVLAAVAYNAGDGALTGYVDKSGNRHPGLLYTIGDPRTGQVSHSDFVKRMPAGETRDYVGKLAHRFSNLLASQ